MKMDLKITTAIAAALMVAGCDRQQDNGWTTDRDTAICTDKQGKRVPDQNCQQQRYAGGGGGVSPFLWYYMGRNSSVPYYGEPARGGSFSRAPGSTYFHAPAGSAVTRSAAISRGGFGSSARSFGSVHA